jgi:cell division septation protein DedD
MKKNILPILIIIVVLFGMLVAVFLSRQQATLRNNAALPTGTGTITFNPASATHYVGDIFPVTLQVNTASSSITSVAFRVSYPYTTSTPELDVVDELGNPVTQITADPALVSSQDWSFPVKSITRSGGIITLDFAAINTNIAGFSSNSPITFATIYFKVNRSASSPVTLTFDQSLSKMMTKSNTTDILKTPTNPIYTILSPTPTPTPVADMNFGGRVYIDSNNNGIFDAGEVGVANRPINVNGSVFCTTLADGTCTRFGAVIVGDTLTVAHTPPSGFTNTSPTSVQVVAGVQGGTQLVNFGIISLASPTPTPGALPPDLVVTNLTWSPTSPSAGTGVTFSATIKNQGSGTSPTGVIHGIAFQVDGTEVTWSDNITSPLAPGASRTQTANGGKTGTATWLATAGTHQITAFVDDVNRISESNESNNTLSSPLIISIATTPTPLPTATPTPTPTPTIAPTATPSPSPSPTPIAALNFTVKLQAINNTGPNSNISVILKNGNTVIYTNNVNATSDSTGIYSGSLSNIAVGNYDVYIKEATHLQRKFASIALVNGINTYNWTGSPLLAGDFDGNNFINILDVAKILAVYTELTTPVTAATQKYDVNNDGVINVVDIALGLTNYTALEVPGD